MRSICKSFFLPAKILSPVLGIFAFMLVAFSLTNKMLPLKPPQARFISPPPLLKHFSFGYNEVISDTLWIRVIQDIDYCDQSAGRINGISICVNNSWLYRMIDTITDLSPKFRSPYAVGSLALTIFITDVDGATKIFEKAIKEYPHDWPILYRAAYHYLYEVKDNRRAAELLIRAADNGAPAWTRTLAGRLYSDSGNLDLAEKLLEDMKTSNQDPNLIRRLEKKIETMKAVKNEEK